MGIRPPVHRTLFSTPTGCKMVAVQTPQTRRRNGRAASGSSPVDDPNEQDMEYGLYRWDASWEQRMTMSTMPILL